MRRMIQIETINGPFLHQFKGSPAKYKLQFFGMTYGLGDEPASTFISARAKQQRRRKGEIKI
jgi:hypothetical protein